MPIDLSGIKDFVEEEIMCDEGIITRDPAGNTNATWDPETGEYDSSENDTVYEGICYITPAGQQPQQDPEGGVEVNEEWYYLNIPLEAARPKDGDRFVATSSLRNQHLVGVPFRIQVDQLGTNKIKQRVRMRRVLHKRLR